MDQFVTRFAPSPTGLLHLGHAYSALAAWRAAEEAGGKLLLRIEDIDQTRCRPEFEQAIYDDLIWLGLSWEEPVRRQSDHMDDFARALDRLIELGVVYRCFKTRKEVLDEIARAPHFSVNGPEGPQYIGARLRPREEEARLAAGEPFAWRLSLVAARDHLGEAFSRLEFFEEGKGPKGESGAVTARPELFGDVILARKDAGTSYHLASVHDDALQGVSHVIRGEDLFYAAHLQRLLQALLDYPTPVYRHHKLITDESGKRFAKRDKSSTLRAMRESGARAEEIRARLGFA